MTWIGGIVFFILSFLFYASFLPDLFGIIILSLLTAILGALIGAHCGVWTCH